MKRYDIVEWERDDLTYREYDMPRESRANCGRCPIEPADEDAETDAYAMMMGPDAY